MSPRTFHRRCLAHLATTPAKLLDKLRVERARELLAAGDRPLKELAVTCGWGTAARMTRAFERELGMSPRAYRLLHTGPPAGGRIEQRELRRPGASRSRAHGSSPRR